MPCTAPALNPTLRAPAGWLAWGQWLGSPAALNPDLGADPLPQNSSYWDMSGRGSAITPQPSAHSASVPSRCHYWTFQGS